MIHPTAIISQKAVLKEDVEIGPYSVVDEGVTLQRDVKIGPFCHIKGATEIGENTSIYTGAVIGQPPQMSGSDFRDGKLYIGKNNIIREYVTIHTATSCDKKTHIGDSNYLMAFSHVAHDCHMSDHVVLCNGSLLAGHCHVGERAFISGNVVIHQFVRIGKLAMVGGLARVNQDVPPFLMVIGNSRIWGLNLVGLKRAGFASSDIKCVRGAFGSLYKKGLSLKSSLAEMAKTDSPYVRQMYDFITQSTRGICGYKTQSVFERIFLEYPSLIRARIATYQQFSQVKRFSPFPLP